MSIRPRWSIWRFLCHDALQHRRTPLHASALLTRAATGLRHDGYSQYSSTASPTAVEHRGVGRREQLRHQTRPKLDNKVVKEGDGHSTAYVAYQNDGRAREQVTHVERYEHLLEELLPASLLERDSAQVQKPFDPAELITILSNAQSDRRGSVNPLSRLVLVHNRPDAALFFVDQLLDHVVAHNSDAIQSPPSTLAWSKGLSDEELRQPLELQRSQNSILPLSHSLEHQYENLPNSGASGLAEVWQFLGYLIVEASNIKSGDTTQVMSLVHQTLAKLHHRGLVPDNIYDWVNSPFSSIAQRSPILHLLSSRILSTLSDATWRSYQDEAITRGEQLGISYQKTQDPPGGRFRLKVRALGPETWLEFVLWCCVESNCPQAGVNIVSLLAEQQSDPWCASSWKSNSEQDLGIQIDWDRAKSRTGGAVGRIEGYSYDNPLAEIPPRTISVEVIFALIEGSIDAVYASDGSCSPSIATFPITVQRLLALLQSHCLPREYVEYISARSFGSLAPSVLERPQALEYLTETVSTARALSTSGTMSSAPTGMDFDSIVQHSQLYAGLLQVSMHARCCQVEVQKAINAYDQIQEMVDQSKMQAIASFLALPPGSDRQVTPLSNKDFILSHGQLPLFRIAAFLDVLTDNNVTSLSEWLIYSTDVDGPLIPTSAFQRASVASALIRYAGANHDLQLLQYVMTAIRSRKLRPPVTVLRLEANAHMQCFEFRSAADCLKALKPAIAGGFHPDNLACLAACILRLEASRHSKGRRRTEVYLADAVALMRDLLQGKYDGSSGDFDIVQRQLFKQQIGHLLQICDNLASSKLNLIASSFRKKFPGSNAPTLQPRTFNILLQGIVEVMGAAEGVRVWDQLCQLPSMGRYEVTSESDAGSNSGDTALPWDVNDDHKSSLYTEHPTLSEDATFEALDPFHGALDESGQKVESNTATSSAAPTILLKSTSFQDFVSVSSPAQSKTEFIDENFACMEEQGHNPVVIPTLRSFMIIVNKAIREASATDGPSSAGQAQRASSLLRSTWVKDRFQAFDIEDEYEDLLRTIGEVSGRVSEWYPRASTRYSRPRAAAERASAVSDLFSAVDRERQRYDVVI